MHQTNSNGMANSIDPDQTAPSADAALPGISVPAFYDIMASALGHENLISSTNEQHLNFQDKIIVTLNIHFLVAPTSPPLKKDLIDPALLTWHKSTIQQHLWWPSFMNSELE